jgi:hypothetical protein
LTIAFATITPFGPASTACPLKLRLPSVKSSFFLLTKKRLSPSGSYISRSFMNAQ